MIANDAWVTPLLVSSALNFEYTSSGVTKYRRTFFPKSLVLTLFKPFTYTIVRSHALGMDTLLTLIPFDHLYSSGRVHHTCLGRQSGEHQLIQSS